MIDLVAFKDGWSKQVNSDLVNIIAKNTPVYILGINNVAELVLNHLNVVGIIDDYELIKTHWHNIPIIKSSKLNKHVDVINCSLSVRPRVAESVLKNVGVKQVFRYAQCHQINPIKFPLPSPLLERTSDLNINLDKWQNIYELLADQKSKSLLLSIIKFNVTSDYYFLNECEFAPNQQYFESFMDYNNETFVDAGGYTGDTSELFCANDPNYNKIYLFEPSTKNLTQARINLATKRDIVFSSNGLSDEVGQLPFDSESGSASSICDNTHNVKNVISVTTIDEAITEPVSFIKMDLEGWEPKALIGARKHITQNAPKLAISVYHNSDDMWKIPEQILSYQSNYQVFLGHYTEGWSETIMYFLPEQKS